MYQTEVSSEVHAHGNRMGYPLPDLSNREPLLLLTSVPEVQSTNGAGQLINRIACTEQMAALKAGDRIALSKGDKVYSIGTVMENAQEDEIVIRYDFVNPVGVAVNHLNQGHRMLTQQEFDMIIIKLIRGY